MKIIARIRGVYLYLLGIKWIHPPAGEEYDYTPVPVYIVTDETTTHVHRSVRVVEDGQ